MANDSRYFRAQAERAQAEADGATLDNVRDRALRSVAAFTAMADGAERITKRRLAREANGGEYGGRSPAAVDADTDAELAVSEAH